MFDTAVNLRCLQQITCFNEVPGDRTITSRFYNVVCPVSERGGVIQGNAPFPAPPRHPPPNSDQVSKQRYVTGSLILVQDITAHSLNPDYAHYSSINLLTIACMVSLIQCAGASTTIINGRKSL